uniref:Uncharacterized protein n=1 Tax=Salmo trutta TaxID=8032 RepID=A0A673ZJR1_SALTR
MATFIVLSRFTYQGWFHQATERPQRVCYMLYCNTVDSHFLHPPPLNLLQTLSDDVGHLGVLPSATFALMTALHTLGILSTSFMR